MAIKITTLLTTENLYTSHNHSVPFLGNHPSTSHNSQLISFLFTHKKISTVFHFSFLKTNFLCKRKQNCLKLYCQNFLKGEF